MPHKAFSVLLTGNVSLKLMAESVHRHLNVDNNCPRQRTDIQYDGEQ